MAQRVSGLFGKSGDTYCDRFCVGAVSVQLLGERPGDVGLGTTLEAFRVKTRASEISIQVTWVTELLRSSGRQLFDSATTWRLYEDEDGLRFDICAAVFGHRPFKRLLIDRKFSKAVLQVSEECFAEFPFTAEPLSYPLDELLIMHRLTQENAIELHGCGIVRADGTGNLFVGHSGAGKSTTTRLWTEREAVEVLSDDRIIVRRPPAAACTQEANTEIPRFARNDNSEKQVPHRRFAPVRNDNVSHTMRMYGTPWHGEAMFASPGSAPLARIFVLEHGQGNVLTRLSASQAVGELFARSFVPFHRHEYVDSALSFLHELVDSVPVYRYAFEPDQRAVDKIAKFRD